MVFLSLLNKLPGGRNVRVFAGTTLLLAVCAVPIVLKEEKKGHDLFSQEKPAEIEEHQNKKEKEYFAKRVAERKN